MMAQNENSNIVIVGGGGHALSLLEAMSDPERVTGYLAPVKSDTMQISWLGGDDNAHNYVEDSLFHIAYIYSGFPEMEPRREIIAYYESLGAKFATIVSSTAVVTKNSKIGEGCALMHHTVINRSVLDKNVVVNTGAIIEHDCVVGENTFIGPGAVVGGSVSIGKNCFIGLGVNIRNGVRITDGVTVGMGTIVTKDLLTPGVYFGNPVAFHEIKKKLKTDGNNNS